MRGAALPEGVIIFGFDSAWVDAPASPGAICALGLDPGGGPVFHAPRPASFAQAAAFIGELGAGYACSLVAIDQPIVVPNARGSRPADRVAASLMSFIGGGVQPANRGKARMFGDQAPIWGFLDAIAHARRPMAARHAAAGRFVIEVFPALSLPALDPGFAGRLAAPKYNPGNRRKFRQEHWVAVARSLADASRALGLPALCDWAEDMARLQMPRKADQDRLDAALCALIGLIWRAGPAHAAACIGDEETGFIVTALSQAIRPRLAAAAQARGVAFRA